MTSGSPRARPDRPGLHRDDPARRSHRHPGAQRLRQDDAHRTCSSGTSPPQAGDGDRRAPGSEVAHFEQLHDALDDAKTVLENLAEGRDTVAVGGVERHVVGYLRDFLFTPEQIQGPVVKLSGGERRRLQLAKILSRPCNLLVLDEPTNDLDLETLELLEELLLEFQGTLLVVSHDRAFLDNVVTSTLVFEGDGRWCEYAGGYEDWLRQKSAAEPPPAAKPSRPKTSASDGAAAAHRLQGKRELAGLPGRIEESRGREAGSLRPHGVTALLYDPG